MASEIVGGIEGGASNSTVVLLNPQGQVVATAKGAGTNHYLIGMEECRTRIAELVNRAKQQAGIALDSPIAALGLSLSGCQLEESNQQLVQGLIEAHPQLARRYAVGSDTDGSIATISNKGGVVCIAGTGSNTLLINPDGQKVQCGGWGYLLGDEGSAWHISWQAVKYCFNDMDKFEAPPHPSGRLWGLVQQFFQIRSQADILDSFYKNFDKSRIALLCKSVAQVAREGDLLARHIFKQAGADLAKGIAAVARQAAQELTEQEGGLQVICVGSVWLSWDLLQGGFNAYLQERTDLQRLTLLRLSTEMGVGAALMASDRLHLPVERDYAKNYKVFAAFCRCDST
ncbi:N-acetyl-D-glucosamine kinase [Dendroctonus ponderosae]|uniref:N-acetyl-D-glucosamine kinase n=1 Tax=Dendroctonus ponderosae TaxID=77166 RepID=U4URE5_DENPD|nr:N-acetyl-D-glucosamine kinase [Dendroctonus ponderosae]ERL95083.1 hypothetical protein D910_12353 [Dendroctonus ponderosae]KAH1018240.1 hypothetical protein HUJ05_006049 [Dendroctonus ponderosae]